MFTIQCEILGSPSQSQVPADSEVRQVVKLLRAAAIGRHDMGFPVIKKSAQAERKVFFHGYLMLFDGHLMGGSDSKRVVAW